MPQAKPDTTIPRRLPLLPLRSTIVYPTGVIGVQIGLASSLEMLAAHPETPLLVGLVVPPGGPDDPIEARSLSGKIGVAARLSDRLNLPGGTVQATVQGIRRIRVSRVQSTRGHLMARAEVARETTPPEDVAKDLIARIITDLDALASEVERVSREVPRILRMNVADPGRFADLVASLANFSVAAKEEVLRRLDVEDRLRYVHDELESQLTRVRRIEDAKDVETAESPDAAALSPTERAERLRDRIKRLQAELGEVDPIEREAIDYLRRIETAELPVRVAAEARAEVAALALRDFRRGRGDPHLPRLAAAHAVAAAGDRRPEPD
jgi:ATP-dependent Lon protease